MPVAQISQLLNGKNISDNRILVTGASGWIGRETIALLQQVFPDTKDFQSRVILAGSRDATVVVNGISYLIRSLSEIQPDEIFDLVIHLAFLTQDKAIQLGEGEYSRRNRELTEFVYQICRRSNSRYVLLASSGAANEAAMRAFTDPSKRLYGRLKRESEERFLQLPSESGSLVEICRIWSISGAYIREPKKYALGNFIAQAKTSGKIELHNSALVKRAYVNAGELMGVLLLNLLSGEGGLIDSGGFETSLLELAKLVLLELSPEGELSLHSELTEPKTDIYVPNVLPFNQLSGRLGVHLSNLQEQIQITAKAEAFIPKGK